MFLEDGGRSSADTARQVVEQQGQQMQLLIRKLVKSTRQRIMVDRAEWMDARACVAQVAAVTHDDRRTFAVVRSLAAGRGRLLRTIKKLDGSLTRSEDEKKIRWQEHFETVFVGKAKPLSVIHGGHDPGYLLLSSGTPASRSDGRSASRKTWRSPRRTLQVWRNDGSPSLGAARPCGAGEFLPYSSTYRMHSQLSKRRRHWSRPSPVLCELWALSLGRLLP